MQRTLTAEEEARNFDKQRDKRGGNDSGLTPRQLKELQKQRKEEQEKRDENAQNEHLQKFTRFYSEGLSYIKELVSMGEFANRDQRTELYNLITLVKIQNALESLVSLLSKKK